MKRRLLGQRLVEILNIGAIAGLPIAVAAYFWANRLVPVEVAVRFNDAGPGRAAPPGGLAHRAGAAKAREIPEKSAGTPDGGRSWHSGILPGTQRGGAGVMTLFPFALTYSGFAALCFATHRHGREVLKRDLPPLQRHGLRALGWGSLTVSLFMAAAHTGWPIGTVEWFGMLAASAVSFVLLLTFAPRLAAALAVGYPCARPRLVGLFS